MVQHHLFFFAQVEWVELGQIQPFKRLTDTDQELVNL